MLQGQRIGAIVLMGGTGSRFGGDVPKQFVLLGDRRVYLHTLEAFKKIAFFDEILLVCHPGWIDTVADEVLGAKVVAGGKTRQESSYLGLQGFSSIPDIVCIHDAVRPFVSEKIIQENIAQAILHGAVDTCIPSADTLVYAPGGVKIVGIPKREEYLRGQTPQTFRFDLIWDAHQTAIKDGIVNSSDDCSLVLRRGHSVYVVTGSESNLKITTEYDLWTAQAKIFKPYQTLMEDPLFLQ